MIAYRIRRKGTEDYFMGAHGQKVFWEKAHAKAAFNYVVKRRAGSWINVSNRFDDQDQWEMVEYELVEKK